MEEKTLIEKERLKKSITKATIIDIIIIVIFSILYYLKQHNLLVHLLNNTLISFCLFSLTLLIICILLKNPKSLYYIAPSESMLFFSTSLVILAESINSLLESIIMTNSHLQLRYYIALWIAILLLIQEILKIRIFTLKKFSLQNYRLFSISIIFITSFSMLFAAILFIFYSKIIATLVGSLLLFLLHSFFKNILPSMYELHDLIDKSKLPDISENSQLLEYEPSIFSKISLAIIDSCSALIIFSYGIAQLFANQYTVILNLNPKSKEFSSIKKLVAEKGIYIDHIEAPHKIFMLSSNQDLFLLVFIITLYITGFVFGKLLQYLYRDIYNGENKIIKDFTDKLVHAKEDKATKKSVSTNKPDNLKSENILKTK